MFRTGKDGAGNREWRRGYAREAAAGAGTVGLGPRRPHPTRANTRRGWGLRGARGHAAGSRQAAWRQRGAPRRFRLLGTGTNSPRLTCRLGDLYLHQG